MKAAAGGKAAESAQVAQKKERLRAKPACRTCRGKSPPHAGQAFGDSRISALRWPSAPLACPTPAKAASLCARSFPCWSTRQSPLSYRARSVQRAAARPIARVTV